MDDSHSDIQVSGKEPGWMFEWSTHASTKREPEASNYPLHILSRSNYSFDLFRLVGDQGFDTASGWSLFRIFQCCGTFQCDCACRSFTFVLVYTGE